MINSLIVYRSGAVLTTFDIDESTVYNEKIPGTKLITCAVTAQVALSIQQGDYITWKSENYVIHLLPDFDKSSDSNTKKYNITFEAEFYQFLDEYVISSTGLKDFPYYGNAAAQLQLIVNNANRDSSGWSVGTVDVTTAQIINYSWTYCREALDVVAEAFGLEYQFTGRVVSMVATVGRDTAVSIQMGRSKGLKGISRKPDTGKNIINRVYAIGGTRNIDSTYRGGLEKNLTIQGGFVQTPGVAAKTESVKEGKYSNDLIFPQYKGVITSTTVTSATDGTVASVTITDTAIDFDVMAYLQSGVTATVGFLTGELTGIELQVANFDFATKKVTLINNTDANGYITPNKLNLPAVGDSFTFYDIRMPAAYVATAEAALLTAATVYLNENKSQILVFTVKTDEKYLRDNLISIKCGDRITITDSDLNLVNQILRFTEISYPIVNEYDITGVIGNEIVYDKVVKLFADVDKNADQIQGISINNIRSARQNSINLNNLSSRVFDPDGSLAQGAATLYAAMTKVGFDSQNFGLIDVAINTNIGGNENAFSITAGHLVHRIYQIDGLGYDWVISLRNFPVLDPAKFYYVYAKCSTTSLTGTWEMSTTPIFVGSFDGFWCFNLGQLFEVNADGYRNFEFTKGITYTVGNTITSGRLQDLTKQNYFDVETAQFNLGDTTSGLDYNVTSPRTLSLRGALVQSGSGIVAPLPALRGTYLSTAVYYKGDTVLYSGSQWIYMSVTPAAGITPIAGASWSLYASAGPAGSNGITGSFTQFRYQKNGSTTTPPLLTNTDVNPANWTLDQPVVNTAEYLWMISAVKNPPDGARNYYTKTSALIATNAVVSSTFANAPNGMLIRGQAGGGGQVRISSVIPSAGTWTISGLIRTNQASSINVDVCDGIAQALHFTLVDTAFSLTYNVADASLGYVDLSAIGNVTIYISNLKIQKGSVSDVWTPAPEDVDYQNASTLVGTWGVPVRTSGVTGSQGPYLSYAGAYSPTRVYVGTSIHVEVTQYIDNLYYLTRTDAGNIPAGTLPTNTMYWNIFGAQFDNIATTILFAKLAYVDNLGVSNLKTTPNDTGSRIEISGAENSMVFYGSYVSSIDPVTNEPITKSYESFRLDDNIDSDQSGVSVGGIRTMTPTGRTAYITGNGVFSNGSSMQFATTASGAITNASVAGLLLDRNAGYPGSLSAGVVGVDQTQVSAYNSGTIYSINKVVTSGGVQYIFINPTPSAGHAPTDTAYWQVYTSKAYAVASIGNLLVTGEIHLNSTGTIKGYTGYEGISPGGTLTRKYISGIYVGQGEGTSW